MTHIELNTIQNNPLAGDTGFYLYSQTADILNNGYKLSQFTQKRNNNILHSPQNQNMTYGV